MWALSHYVHDNLANEINSRMYVEDRTSYIIALVRDNEQGCVSFNDRI